MYYLQNWRPLSPKFEASASFRPVWHHSQRLFFLNIARRWRPKHRSLQNRLRTRRPPRISESEINAHGPCLWHHEQQPEEERSITVSSSGSSTSISLFWASWSESGVIRGSFFKSISFSSKKKIVKSIKWEVCLDKKWCCFILNKYKRAAQCVVSRLNDQYVSVF